MATAARAAVAVDIESNVVKTVFEETATDKEFAAKVDAQVRRIHIPLPSD